VNKTDKILNVLVAAVSPTIVLHPEWKDSCPDWLLEEIKLQRLKDAATQATTASDLEALAYMMTASLAGPMTDTGFKIYIHLFFKVFPDKALDAGLKDVEFTDYEEMELRKLKDWIYKKRSEQEKERFKEKR